MPPSVEGKDPSPCRSRVALGIFTVAAASVAVTVACLFVGRYPKPGFMPISLLLSDPTARAVLFGSRLPRLIAAILLGAVLGSSGNAFQMVFANPLAEPGFLGVTQGAALGAALALVSGAQGDAAIAVSAFAVALLGLGASVRLARAFSFGGWVLRMALSGLAVSAALSAGLAIVKFGADPLKELPDIAYWTMGSLAGAGWKKTAFMAVPCIASTAFLVAYGWRITALSVDETVASSLGLRPRVERAIILVFASAGVAAAVAVAGTVTWVGLVVPHVARRLAGADARFSMPVSVLLGATFAAVCDTIARAALPGELPLGAVTALLGAGAFVAMFSKGSKELAR
ncbi:MAG: iron ABC transporter permease [Spirochaetes bacterium]|nr:iron ABC transporter permease [Spirochaetota bacterium]